MLSSAGGVRGVVAGAGTRIASGICSAGGTATGAEAGRGDPDRGRLSESPGVMPTCLRRLAFSPLSMSSRAHLSRSSSWSW